MVLPLPAGRAARAWATSGGLATHRRARRRARRQHALLAPARELFERAHVVLQTGDEGLAASLFGQCVAAVASLGGRAGAAARLLRAMAMTQLGRLAEGGGSQGEAAQHYAASVAAWPRQSEAHYWLAQQALAAGQLDRAERRLRRAAAPLPTGLGAADAALLQEQRDRGEIARYDLSLLLAQRGAQAEASSLARGLVRAPSAAPTSPIYPSILRERDDVSRRGSASGSRRRCSAHPSPRHRAADGSRATTALPGSCTSSTTRWRRRCWTPSARGSSPPRPSGPRTATASR